jgi:hypothetical protein
MIVLLIALSIFRFLNPDGADSGGRGLKFEFEACLKPHRFRSALTQAIFSSNESACATAFASQ